MGDWGGVRIVFFSHSFFIFMWLVKIRNKININPPPKKTPQPHLL